MNIDIPFLIPLMKNEYFSLVFVLLCFLFIVNGANLIDGFNGLLVINLIIINLILTYINLTSNNTEFFNFIDFTNNYFTFFSFI